MKGGPETSDDADHAEGHLDARVGVVLTWLGQSAHAVVAVTEDLDPQAVVPLRQSAAPQEKKAILLLSSAHEKRQVTYEYSKCKSIRRKDESYD